MDNEDPDDFDWDDDEDTEEGPDSDWPLAKLLADINAMGGPLAGLDAAGREHMLKFGRRQYEDYQAELRRVRAQATGRGGRRPPGHEEDSLTHDALAQLEEHLRACGPVILQGSSDGSFMASSEWGEEAPDSPMAGAAAYGVGATLAEALAEVLEHHRG